VRHWNVVSWLRWSMRSRNPRLLASLKMPPTEPHATWDETQMPSNNSKKNPVEARTRLPPSPLQCLLFPPLPSRDTTNDGGDDPHRHINPHRPCIKDESRGEDPRRQSWLAGQAAAESDRAHGTPRFDRPHDKPSPPPSWSPRLRSPSPG